MSIIDEIKNERVTMIDEDYKVKVLTQIKHQLTEREYAVIDGARHYQVQEWKFKGDTYVKAPYKYHAALATWLEKLGFKTSRYYNNGGIDNGLRVWI